MSFLFQVSNHVSRTAVNLNVRAKKAELALKEQEKVWKSTNEDLLMKVELLSKEKVEKGEEHATEMQEVIVEVRSSVVVAVWEAKINVAEDVANVGSWNVASQLETLAKLTSELVNTGQDPVKQLQVRGDEEGAEKVLGVDDQFVV